ncbi:Cytochrome P450 71D11 (Fragment) [Linum grandiflorum]
MKTQTFISLPLWRSSVFQLMDLLSLSFQTHTLLALALLFLCFLFTWRKLIKPKTVAVVTNLPPGPWKLPIIGNMHQLIHPLPHRRLRDLAAKYGPLIHLQLGQVSAVVISSSEITKHVIKTHDINFSNRPFLLAAKVLSEGDIAFAPYGEYWRQLRRVCTLELLSSRRVGSYRSIREQETAEFVREIASREGSVTNLSKMIGSLTSCITARAAFGKKCGDEQEEFLRIVKEIMETGSGFSLPDMFPSSTWLHVFSGLERKLVNIRRRTDTILGKIIDEHRHKQSSKSNEQTEEEEEDDLVDVLLLAQKEGHIHFPTHGDTCLKSIILRVYKKAQSEVRQVFGGKGKVTEDGIEELKYLKMVVKEALRLHPPAPLLARQTAEDVTIEGYHIPAKTKILVNVWAIARDPKHWKEPDRFWPERFTEVSSSDFQGTDFMYMPFGFGRRICPGINFGIANVELPLASLLYHFDWKTGDGSPLALLDASEFCGATVVRKHELCLIPVCHPSSN